MLRSTTAAVALAFLLLGCGRGVTADANRQSHVAGVLFAQFETVYSSKASLLASSNGYGGLSAQDADTLALPFGYLLAALNSLGNQSSADMLANSDVVLVGAKDFLPPAGLGPVRSKRCYVVVLRNQSRFDLHKYFQGAPTASSVGMPLWSWSAKLGEFGENDPKPSSLHATQVGQSYVLVSNDLQELQSLAEHLASSSADFQSPSGVRDWTSVTQHEVWGYRRYRHNDVVDPMAAGMADVTPGAEALTFYFDSKRKAGVLGLLLKSPADERTVARMNSRAVLPPLKPSGVGAWQTTFPLTGDEDSFEHLANVAGLFGFATYV